MLPITMADSGSQTLQNVLDEFLPSDVIRIVDGYFAHSDAVEMLALDGDGQVADSELNRQTVAAIKIALATGSCDVLRLIFQNADEGGYASHLNVLMNEMREQEIPILLDGVDFSGIDLSGVQFDRASMTKANFSEAHLNFATFFGADLSGATGLASALGDIRVDFHTVLTQTPIFFDVEDLRSTFGNISVLISLVDTPCKFGYIPLTGYGHKIWLGLGKYALYK